MIEPPRVLRTESRLTATLSPGLVPRAEIARVMGPGIAELTEAVAAQGVAVTGPLFTHHFRQPTDTFDFEIGLPVANQVRAAGRMMAGVLPAATVARTVYHGGYEGLAAAWGEFQDWITANGHEKAGELWECYVAGPNASADPATWRTELNQPLLRAGGG